jgi:hypothetical protein
VKSDAALKQNIADIESALPKIAALRPVTYEWNEQAHALFRTGVEEIMRSDEDTPEGNERLWEKERGRIRQEHSGRHLGFTAQNVEQVMPGWVRTGDDGYKTINTFELQAVLVKAMQEMRAEYQGEIERLEAEIEALRRADRSTAD